MIKIVSYITNGLGNQLFQYACGYSLAKKYNAQLLLNLSWFKRKEHSIKFKLDALNINMNISDNINSDIKLTDVDHNQRYFYKEILLNANKIYELHGYWMNSRYFNNQITKIKNMFVPNNLLNIKKRNSQILQIIKSNNSIAVHIRRADFLHDKTRQVCDLRYYEKSINKILKHVNNPYLIFFSDDMQWTKNNLRYDNVPTFYCEGESDMEDFYLMSQCKHNIIPNSSFSWWAAFLNKNKNKIVIYPNKWKTTHKNNTLKIGIPPEWN